MIQHKQMPAFPSVPLLLNAMPGRTTGLIHSNWPTDQSANSMLTRERLAKS
jgi:hypothetical protein